MTEQKVLKIAKKIVKRRIRRFFFHMIYETLRAILTFSLGILIVAASIFVILLTCDNGTYDITPLLFLIPIAIGITKERFLRYYRKGKIYEANVCN